MCEKLPIHWSIILILSVVVWSTIFSLFDLISTNFLENYTNNTFSTKFWFYFFSALLALLLIYYLGHNQCIIDLES